MPRGGKRKNSGRPRKDKHQLTILVTPSTEEKMRRIAKEDMVSLGEVLDKYFMVVQ